MDSFLKPDVLAGLLLALIGIVASVFPNETRRLITWPTRRGKLLRLANTEARLVTLHKMHQSTSALICELLWQYLEILIRVVRLYTLLVLWLVLKHFVPFLNALWNGIGSEGHIVLALGIPIFVTVLRMFQVYRVHHMATHFADSHNYLIKNAAMLRKQLGLPILKLVLKEDGLYAEEVPDNQNTGSC